MTDKVLDKIRKLHAMAKGAEAIGSEAEAQAFAQLVNRMLNQHRLELTDLAFEEERRSEPVDQHWINWEAHHVRTRQARVLWIERLSSLVARAHTCSIMIMPKTSRILLVGTETNRQIVEYLLVTLIRTAEAIADKEYVAFYYKCRDEGDVTRCRGFRAAFLLGFTDRIGQRFHEEKRRMENDPNGTALVRFDRARADVEAFMKANAGKPASALGQRRVNGAGYEAGRAKADSMDIKGNAVKSNEQRRIG